MRHLTVTLALLLLSSPIFGQVLISVDEQRKDYLDNATIYYRINESKVDTTYLTNREALDLVRKRLTDIESINHLDSITLMATASPDGPVALNNSLAESRAKMLKEYLIDNYPKVANKLTVGSVGEDWEGFRAMVVDDHAIPNRTKVLEFIDSNAEPDVKEWRIKQLDGGESWNYLKTNILPYLRSGASAIFHYDITYIEKYSTPEPIEEPEVVLVQEIEPTPEPIVEEEKEEEIKPLLALKTNLLFDVATLLNVEIEVPIGNRWSVAGEWIFPWWTSCGNKNNSWQSSSSSHRNTLEILNANIEGKYWLGDRASSPLMTGWYLGLYAGGGKYDLEYHAEGYQGEFFIAAGLSCGYAHTIFENRLPDGNLRLEYSLGVGYLQTEYRYYEEHWGIDDTWHTLRQNNGTYTWIGPTRARVSLVWMFNRKVNKEK